MREAGVFGGMRTAAGFGLVSNPRVACCRIFCSDPQYSASCVCPGHGDAAGASGGERFVDFEERRARPDKEKAARRGDQLFLMTTECRNGAKMPVNAEQPVASASEERTGDKRQQQRAEFRLR